MSGNYPDGTDQTSFDDYWSDKLGEEEDMAIIWDNDDRDGCSNDDFDDHDEEDDGLNDCQITPDGFCQLAGTEECDECPLMVAMYEAEAKRKAGVK